MPRPKGSKNKTARVVKKKDVGVEIDTPIVESIAKPVVVPKAVKEMGTECACGHPKEKHYGPVENPSKTWCNHGGCACQAYSLKN